MKIYVVGTGGVGGYFGGLLAKSGQDVTFVARGEHFDVIKNSGLTVKSVNGDFIVNPVKVVDRISEISDPDLILFTVKTYQTEDVAKELSVVVNEETTVITFQNGIDNDLRIMDVLSKTSVYPGVAMVIAKKVGPGIISQTGGLCKLVFGSRGRFQNEKLKEVETIMKNSNIDATLSDDIIRDLWKKFLFIIPFAGLTAITRSTIGEVMSDPVMKLTYEDCLREAMSVAKALEVRLPDDVFESVMKMTLNTVSTAKSSLLVDIESGRPTEIETLHGTLVMLASENKIKVPINERIYTEIKSLKN